MMQYFGENQQHRTERPELRNSVEMQIPKSESSHANNLGVTAWTWRHTD
jgi:hypothetical protein